MSEQRILFRGHDRYKNTLLGSSNNNLDNKSIDRSEILYLKGTNNRFFDSEIISSKFKKQLEFKGFPNSNIIVDIDENGQTIVKSNNNLITLNNKIGINNFLPNYSIDLFGSAKLPSIFNYLDDNSNTNTNYTITSDGAGKFTWKVQPAGDIIFGANWDIINLFSATQGFTTITNSSSTAITPITTNLSTSNVNNSVIQLNIDSYNVGINSGTKAPSKALTVNGKYYLQDNVSNSINIGNENVGKNNQQSNAIAIGINCGQFSQQSGALSIGYNAGQYSQQQNGIAVGYQAGQTFQRLNAITIGRRSGAIEQRENSIAIGNGAGVNNQRENSIAMGSQTAGNNQGTYCIAIGPNSQRVTPQPYSIGIGRGAGELSSREHTISIGYYAGVQNKKSNSISVGFEAGGRNQNFGSVALGYFSGRSQQGTHAVAIGTEAGLVNQGTKSVAIGYQSAFTNQGENSIAIGYKTGYTDQDGNCIAIGFETGKSQQTYSIAIGHNSGNPNSRSNAISIGSKSGGTDTSVRNDHSISIGSNVGYRADRFCIFIGKNSNTGFGLSGVSIGENCNNGSRSGVGIGYFAGQRDLYNSCIAIGYRAAARNAGAFGGGPTVAIGYKAGESYQRAQAVAIGYYAGNNCQGTRAIAIGLNSGQSTQGFGGIALGYNAGASQQGQYSIAIGRDAQAFNTNNPNYSIAIGYKAGETNSAANSIILNATTNAINAATQGLYLDPNQIRTADNTFSGTTASNKLWYDPLTHEIFRQP